MIRKYAPSLFLCLALTLSGLSLSAHAKDILVEGKIVGISDGDTATLVDAGKTRYRIRLLGIDAPERTQAFGQRSRQMLSDLAYGKQVRAECIGKDRYNRYLCKIRCDGKDVNLQMIEAGMAWHYKHYQSDQAADDRKQYSQAEKKAREEKTGLWRDSNPTPPWNFRREKRRKN